VASIVGQGCAGLVDGVAQAGLDPREVVVRVDDGAQRGAPLVAELLKDFGVLADGA